MSKIKLLFILICTVNICLSAEIKKPNILVIVTDDQGYADLSAYDHSAPDVKTPNMDRLAKRGILYTNAYSVAPVCSPSRAGWTTGRHPINWDPKAGFNCGLPKSIKTMAEMFKANGYKTARIGKSDYSNKVHRQDIREYPLNHGYDEFLGFCAHGFDNFLLTKEIEKKTPDPRGHSAALGELFHNRSKKSYNEGYLTQIFTDEAIDYLKRNQENPFFLTLSYNLVHHLIHQAPKKYLDKFGVKEIPNYDPSMGSYNKWFTQYITLGKISDVDMRKYYLANLNCLDDHIGRVLDTLTDLELADNTIIFFFSDNGGPPTNGANNKPLSGSKFTLWEGGIRIPFIYCAPGMKKAGTISDQVISALDVLPSSLMHAGIDIPKDLEGEALGDESQARNLFWQFNNSYAVRSGKWKLTKTAVSSRQPTSGVIDRRQDANKLGLYNLEDDPGESKDLSQSHPEIKQRLEKLYQSWFKERAKDRNHKRKVNKK